MDLVLNASQTGWLALFTIVLFIIFAFLGWFFPNEKNWNFVDPFYYALAAIGVILIFASKQNIRDSIPYLEEQELIEQVEAITKKKIGAKRKSDTRLRWQFFKVQQRKEKYTKRICAINPTSSTCKDAKDINEYFYQIIPYVSSIRGTLKHSLTNICNYMDFASHNYDRIKFMLRSRKNNIISKKKIETFVLECTSSVGLKNLSKRKSIARKNYDATSSTQTPMSSWMAFFLHHFWAYILSFAISLKLGKWFSHLKNSKIEINKVG